MIIMIYIIIIMGMYVHGKMVGDMLLSNILLGILQVFNRLTTIYN